LANKSELLQSKLRRNATICLVASVANFTVAVALLIMMKAS
jgi:hypothetical protein